tara:strand:- start:4203 stop:4490 length:288 start_codon:yes stop_codon:yes gene_type:complete
MFFFFHPLLFSVSKAKYLGVRLLKVFEGEHNRQELQELRNLSDRKCFRENYLQPALDAELIEMTIPVKPKSRKQQYRLTEKESNFKLQIKSIEKQ